MKKLILVCAGLIFIYAGYAQKNTDTVKAGNHVFPGWYADPEGIIFQNTVPYCPEQNGIGERKNCTLDDAMRTLMHNSDLPPMLWQEAILNAVYTFLQLSD